MTDKPLKARTKEELLKTIDVLLTGLDYAEKRLQEAGDREAVKEIQRYTVKNAGESQSGLFTELF